MIGGIDSTSSVVRLTRSQQAAAVTGQQADGDTDDEEDDQRDQGVLQ